MSIAETLLPEFDLEMAMTRKLLERTPEKDGDWKPHEKSMPLGGLAVHVAMLPGWITLTLTANELDLAPPDGSKWSQPPFTTTKALVALFDESVTTARATLAATGDAAFAQPWTLKAGAHTIFTLPRTAVLRSFVMNHLIHHRAQLGVYYRLRNVALPQMYGPTADEQ